MNKNGPQNFARPKGQKTQKRTRKSRKKAKPGAFWVLEGMRTVKGRCKRMGKTGKLGGNRGTDLSRLPPRSVRGRAPLVLARPSARGFGVDVGGTQQAAGERQGCAVLPAKSQKSGAGLVLRALFGEGLCIDYHFFLRKKSTSARRMAKLTRITAG